MKKSLRYLIFVIIVGMIIILIYYGIANRFIDVQTISGDDMKFSTLCNQWRSHGCTMGTPDSALTQLDNMQATMYNEETLSSLCLRLHNQGDDTKTLVFCQDTCKNACNPQLYYDVGIYANDFTWTSLSNGYSVEVKIRNVGSGTVYNVPYKITDIISQATILSETIPILYSNTTYSKTVTVTGKSIRVEHSYPDGVETNNFAESSVV